MRIVLGLGPLRRRVRVATKDTHLSALCSERDQSRVALALQVHLFEEGCALRHAREAHLYRRCLKVVEA